MNAINRKCFFFLYPNQIEIDAKKHFFHLQMSLNKIDYYLLRNIIWFNEVTKMVLCLKYLIENVVCGNRKKCGKNLVVIFPWGFFFDYCYMVYEPKTELNMPVKLFG